MTDLASQYFLRFIIAAMHFTDLVRYLGNSAFAPEGVDDGTSVLVPDTELLGCLLDLDTGVRSQQLDQLVPLLIRNSIILPHHFSPTIIE